MLTALLVATTMKVKTGIISQPMSRSYGGNGKCTLCHEEKKNEEPSRKNINAYGKAIQGDAAMKPLLGKAHDYAWTDKEIATRVRALAADSVNPLSVPCVLCKRTGGESCVELLDCHTRIKPSGFHPLRDIDAMVHRGQIGELGHPVGVRDRHERRP